MTQEPIRSALFVDFDNLYLGLRNYKEEAAEAFATDPAKWLKWYENGASGASENERQRRVLVRRCYLNPRTFHPFRSHFTRGGFTVVDCPPLTNRGKTSSDVYLVLDVLDVLSQYPHVEEFAVLSADADFTPVLIKLRANDKRTTVLAAGHVSSAYMASCDLFVSDAQFVEHALGLDPTPTERPAQEGLGTSERASTELLASIATEVAAAVEVQGELLGGELPRVLKVFPEFTPDSNWLGFYGLRALAQAIVEQDESLDLTDEENWRIRNGGAAPTVAS